MRCVQEKQNSQGKQDIGRKKIGEQYLSEKLCGDEREWEKRISSSIMYSIYGWKMGENGTKASSPPFMLDQINLHFTAK